MVSEWALRELEGSEDYCLLSEVNTLIGCVTSWLAPISLGFYMEPERMFHNFLNMILISMATNYAKQYQMNDKLVLCMLSFCFFVIVHGLADSKCG